jgi:drug/metabolite transporter (DMT)-like permease
MTASAIALVAVSAALHAGWNLVCKKQKSPGAVFFLVMTLSSVILWLPFVLLILWGGGVRIPAAVWCLLLLSGLANAVYYTGLGLAYRRSDISLSYPLVKGLPILIVTIFCALAGTAKLTPWGLAGIAALLLGGMIIPLGGKTRLSVRSYITPSLGFVLLAAVASAGYMLSDSEGMRILKNIPGAPAKYQISMLYIFFENLLILPFLAAFIFFSAEERGKLAAFSKDLSFTPLITGVMCTLSYSLVLTAMSLSDNVGMIVALRQMSVPLGAFAGIALLKERGDAPKIIGAAAITAGLFMVCAG